MQYVAFRATTIIAFIFAITLMLDGQRGALAAAGEWVQCWMTLSNGTAVNVVNGHRHRDTCFALQKVCAQGHGIRASGYRSPPFILQAPYVRCTATLAQERPAPRSNAAAYCIGSSQSMCDSHFGADSYRTHLGCPGNAFFPTLRSYCNGRNFTWKQHPPQGIAGGSCGYGLIYVQCQ